MTKGKYVSVAKDFSPHPGPRRASQGPHSGEKFRKQLVRTLKQHDYVVVDLDGTTGYGSSFLDEVFGGLITHEGMTRDEVLRRVSIKSDQDESYKLEALEAIDDAARTSGDER